MYIPTYLINEIVNDERNFWIQLFHLVNPKKKALRTFMKDDEDEIVSSNQEY